MVGPLEEEKFAWVYIIPLKINPLLRKFTKRRIRMISMIQEGGGGGTLENPNH